MYGNRLFKGLRKSNDEGREDSITINVHNPDAVDGGVIADSSDDDYSMGEPVNEGPAVERHVPVTLNNRNLLDLKEPVLRGTFWSDEDKYKLQGVLGDVGTKFQYHIGNVSYRQKIYQEFDKRENRIQYSCSVDSSLVALSHVLDYLDEEKLNTFMTNKGTEERLGTPSALEMLTWGLTEGKDIFDSVLSDDPSKDDEMMMKKLHSISFYCGSTTGYPERDFKDGRHYVGLYLNLLRYYKVLRKTCLEPLESPGHDDKHSIDEEKSKHIRGFHLIRYFWIYHYFMNLQTERTLRYYHENPTDMLQPSDSYYQPIDFKSHKCLGHESLFNLYPTLTCIYSLSFYDTMDINKPMLEKGYQLVTKSARAFPDNQPASIGYIDDIFKVVRTTDPKRPPIRKLLSVPIVDTEAEKVVIGGTSLGYPELLSEIQYSYYTKKDIGDGYNISKKFIICKSFLESVVLGAYDELGEIFAITNTFVLGSAPLHYWSLENLIHPKTKSEYKPMAIVINEESTHFTTLLRCDKKPGVSLPYWIEYDNLLEEDGSDIVVGGDPEQNPVDIDYVKCGVLLEDNDKHFIGTVRTSEYITYGKTAGKLYGETLERQLVWYPKRVRINIEMVMYVKIK